jgi:subtilisin family serine protease
MRAAARAALAAVAALLPVAGRAQERPVGPTVRVLARLTPADRARLATDSVASRTVAVTRDADGVPVAHLLIRTRGADVGPLLRLGARLGTRIGTLVNARVPLESLPRLLADGAVAAAYDAHRWAPVNDLGIAAIGAAGLRQMAAPDSFTGAVGRGVIVGLVDSGLDFGHLDFVRDAEGRSRVLYLWDQTLAGPGPGVVGATSFGYGIECSQTILSSGGCPSRDSVGHGTHVAGTAAGDGSATGASVPAGKYAGVAPGADLIVVKTDMSSPDVVDGVNYVFSRAAQLGRPAVVNLSLGSQWGPHDGTLPEEEELDSLAGPGRIIVAAAGNDGDNGNATPALSAPRLHGSAPVPGAGLTTDFTLPIPAYAAQAGPNNDFVRLQLWYAASDTVNVTVLRPDGTSATSGATSPATAIVTQDGPQGQIHIENGPGNGVARSADNLAYVVVGDLGGGTEPASGTWTIQVGGVAAHSGKPMHLWVADATMSPVGLAAGSTNGFLVAAPATATQVLAVGAYVTRLRWKDVNGEPEQYSNREQLGDLAWFSGPGPRRDGVQKPDLAAPGQGVASALSGAASVPAGRMMQDGRHWILEGTSMAAPFVTGAVALLLERDARLTPEAARALLVGAARLDSLSFHPYDGRPNGAPNASWGYGKLSVPAALEALSASMLGPGGTINISENPVRGSLVVIHVSGPAVRAGVYTFDGSLVRDLGAAPAGRLQWDLTAADGRPVVNGVYLLVVDLGGTILRHRIYVARRSP